MTTEDYEIERKKEKKADKVFFLGVLIAIMVAIVMVCSGCEQLKEHQSDLNQWIIQWLQEKGSEGTANEHE